MGKGVRQFMPESEEANSSDADLRDQLKSMESKLRRLRDIRQQHNEAGKRSADSRNAIQKEYNKLRDEIDSKLKEKTTTLKNTYLGCKSKENPDLGVGS